MNMSKDTLAVLNILADNMPSVSLLKNPQRIVLTRGKNITFYDNSQDNIIFNFVEKLIYQGLGENYKKEDNLFNVFDFEGLTIRIQSVSLSSKPACCNIHMQIFKQECCSLRKWINEIEKNEIYKVLSNIQTNNKLERI